MSCMPQNFSSIFDHSARDTSMSFVFHTHDLTNILVSGELPLVAHGACMFMIGITSGLE